MKLLQLLLTIRAVATAHNTKLAFPSLLGVASFVLVALVSILTSVSPLGLEIKKD